MRVLTVFAHPRSASFCHAVLERFDAPLLTHQKTLIIQTTIFDKAAYDAGLGDAIHVLVDEFALRYPRIRRADREYCYAVHDADTARLGRYLERAQQLGREF